MYVIGLVLAWLPALMIIFVGVMYLLKNESNAAGFGLPTLPDKAARSWWQLKGVRDIVTGVAPIVITFTQPAALPWLILIEAMIPIGDMLIIVGNRGSRGRAFGVHGLTALIMIIASALLWLG